MEYRKLPKGPEMIGTIGLGMGNIYLSPDPVVEETLFYAVDHGINLYDMCCGRMEVYRAFGRAVAGRREKVYTQMHFGATYKEENYGLSRDPELIKYSFDKMLRAIDTDYTDFGYIHCIDKEEDVDQVMRNGTWDYVCRLKEQGVVRHIGFSTHTPAIVRRFFDTGMVDICMFSINPAYDYSKGHLGKGSAEERAALYRQAEELGIGIVVMKPFAGGQLLDAALSSLDMALSRNQCIQYALDRPGVICCLPGASTVQEVQEALAYYDAGQAERDYAVLEQIAPAQSQGRCVYCNHCAPCPRGIDIGQVNKYYDLALRGDEIAKGHYQSLKVKADACVQCGHCERTCPFHVKQMTRMREIQQFFG